MRGGGFFVTLIIGLIGSLFGAFLFDKLGVRVVPDFWGELITATLELWFFWHSGRRFDGPEPFPATIHPAFT
jgi:hypothetical protein